MIPKPLDAITAQDINDLVTDAVPEGVSLDYMQPARGNGMSSGSFAAQVPGRLV